MYEVDELDSLEDLLGAPKADSGAPCPIVFAEEHKLVLSYWGRDESPYQLATAPRIFVQFGQPRMHLLGPPGDEAIDGHPLAQRGLYPGGAFRVNHSSLVRALARMDSVHRCHDPLAYQSLVHYVFTFHDSTFECVARSLEAKVEQVGLHEEYDRTYHSFIKEKPHPAG
jgi:hypothetical protein